VGYFRKQNLDAESAASSNRAGYPYVAAHDPGEQPADGETKSGSGLRLGNAKRAAFEGCEDALEIAGLDARTGVDHLKFGDRAAIVHSELHASGLGEFDGVR